MGHCSRPKDEQRLPVLSFDYAFLCGQGESTEPEEEGSNPVLAMRDSASKGDWAYLIPAEGVSFSSVDRVVQLIVEDLKLMGYKRVAFRSDGEPALLSLMNMIGSRWDGEVVPGVSAPGDPA